MQTTVKIIIEKLTEQAMQYQELAQELSEKIKEGEKAPLSHPQGRSDDPEDEDSG